MPALGPGLEEARRGSPAGGATPSGHRKSLPRSEKDVELLSTASTVAGFSRPTTSEGCSRPTTRPGTRDGFSRPGTRDGSQLQGFAFARGGSRSSTAGRTRRPASAGGLAAEPLGKLSRGGASAPNLRSSEGYATGIGNGSFAASMGETLLERNLRPLEHQASATAPSISADAAAALFGNGGDQWGTDVTRRRHAAKARSLSAARSNPNLHSSNSISSTAPTTQDENRRNEKVQERISQLGGLSSGAASPARRGSRPEAWNAETFGAAPLPAAAFLEDVKSFEATLEHLSRSIRMEHLDNDDADKKRAAQAEEQRRIERERERKLREQARQAQNPKRRVELRLQQFREFGPSNEINLEKEIPMLTIIDTSGPEIDKVELVNVTAMQGKCLGLNAGGSGFDKLKQAADERDKMKKWEKYAFPNGMRNNDFIAANATSGGDSMMSRTLLSERLLDQERLMTQKQAIAKAKRSSNREEYALMKVQQTKGMYPLEGRCCNAEQEVALKAYREKHEMEILARLEAHAKVHRENMRRYQLRVPGGGRPSGARVSAATRRSSVVSKRMSVDASAPPEEAAPAEEVGGEEAPAVVVPRSVVIWRVMRSAYMFVCVLHSIRRKRAAAAIVEDFVEKLALKQQMDRAMKELLRRLHRVQHVTRQFLVKKNRWCDKAVVQWRQHEDAYLKASFHLNEGGTPMARKALNPGQKGSAAAKKEQDKLKADAPGGATDWKLLRIPPAKRRFYLGRWYFIRLRVSMQVQQGWAELMANATSTHKDVQRFYDLCGLTAPPPDNDSALKDLAQAVAPQSKSEIFALREKDILELVAEAADELRDVAPFQAHPANINGAGLQATPELKPGGRTRRAMARQSVQLRTLQQQSTLWLESKKPLTGPSEEKQKLLAARSGTKDPLEEAFKRFTPRLRGALAAPDEGGDEEAIPLAAGAPADDGAVGDGA